jgi:hypothetical protein
MQARLDRALLDTRQLVDLRQGVTFQVMQRQQNALLLI